MKLLLADDEIITRKGLIENIDWEALRIDQILEAEDGVQALELAKKHAPEVILTDIRMPRMDGVDFAWKIHEILPLTSIIFMSGYTDTEYLQAAIRLKAISYVEKPIDHNEVTQAVAEAIRMHEQRKRNSHYNRLQEQERSAQLALSLIYPVSQENSAGQIAQLQEQLDLPFGENTWFQTLLLKTFPSFPKLDHPDLTAILEKLVRMMKAKPFDFLCALKYDGVLVFHVYAQHMPDRAPLEDFYHYMTRQLEPERSWFLAVGPFVQGTARVHDSYNQAAVLLQSSFFYDYNNILTEQAGRPVSSDVLEQAILEFRERISRRDAAGAAGAAQSLHARLTNCQSLLPSNAKDTYFKLFISLEEAYRMQRFFDAEGTEPIWDRVYSCNTLNDLHEMLLEELNRLDARSQEEIKESGPVSMMRDYIQKNYAVDTLSVKDISAHAGLSVAYACTLFKSETGTTMNQYLTGYRIEKAKQLLADSRIRIADISTRVGYLDGNYFGKSFKKAVGLTPSEYREKLLT